MARGTLARSLSILVVAACTLGPALRAGAQTTFSNTGAITINDFAAAVPYPSSIVVSGMSGTITKVTLTLTGVSAGSAGDLDALLVAPGGANLVVLSDIGGVNTISNVNLTLDDAAGSLLSSSGAPATGTYKPTNNGSGDTFTGPAPAPTAEAAPAGVATFASVFNGISPNGTWSLYVVDDASDNSGAVSGGWSLTITTVSLVPTTTTVVSNLNPSFTGDGVTFTATVTSANPVTSGSVAFLEGVTVLASSVPVNGSGNAALTTSALAEGSHVITAVYSGTASFATSNGSVVQQVNDHTAVDGNEFCNPGALAINASGGGSPYPARIFVSGLAGTVSGVTLKLAGLTHPSPDDLDVLLVGPTGARLVPMSDVGGATAVSGITLALADSAASQLPDAAALTGGTFLPTSQAPAGDVFPAPAPAGPYALAAPDGAATFASAFAGTDPNGTWSVFVANDGTGGAGEIASDVCLAFTTTTPDLAIAKTHDRPLARLQQGVQYSIVVTNNGPGSTVGTVTVTDTLPVGLTATSFSGSGWTCDPLPALSCSRSDPLAAGNSYPPVVLVADVAADPPATIANTATVAGGGAVASANDQAVDEAAVSSTAIPALGLGGLAALAALVAAAGAVAARRPGSA